MTGDKHATKDSGDKAKAQSSSDGESAFSFHSVMGHLKSAKDVVVEKGGQAIHGGAALIKENAPKVKEAAVEAKDSKVGKAVIAAGTDAYRDEKKHVIGIGEAAKKGDVKTLVREGAPLLAGGPAGYLAERAGEQAIKQGVKALPAEHQGTARGALEIGKVATGGIPDAKHVLTGVVLDDDKRGKAMDAVSGAGKKAWNWIKGGDGDSDAKVEAKAGKKSGQVEYPDNEKPQDLPKRPATKK